MVELIFIIKILWLCFVVYFLVKESILAYIVMRTFFMTGDLKEEVEKIPSNSAMRTITVVLAIGILFS